MDGAVQMSKTRQKTHNEIEHLQGEIRKLKSQNRFLKKRIKELEKWQHLYEDNFLETNEPEIIIPEVDTCPKCKDGAMEYKDFIHLQLMVCNVCDYREKYQNGQKKSSTKQGSKKVNNTKTKRDKSLLVRKKKSTRRSKN